MDVRHRVIDAGLRVLGVYWRIAAPLSVGVRGIVVAEDGRIALVRHAYGDRSLHLPGGGVKRRESLVAGFGRELEEETGLRLTATERELRLLGVYTNREEGKSDHVSVFVVEPGQWEGRTEAGGLEIERVVFADPRQPPDGVSPGTRRRLEEWLGVRETTFTW